MALETTMTYGDYSFIPVPFISIQKEFTKTEDGTPIGTVFRATLNGTLSTGPTGIGGIINTDALQDALREGLADEGKKFEIKCDTTTLLKAYPRISSISLNTSNNNWVFTTPYTVELEWDDEPGNSGENTGLMPPYISSASEEWEVEVQEDRNKFDWMLENGRDQNSTAIRLTHTVSANGKRHYQDAGGTDGELRKPAWQEARDWVIPKLGYDQDKAQASGVLNINLTGYTAYNHVRTNSVSETAGSFSVTESWIIVDPTSTGIPGNALEDFTISVNESVEDGKTTVQVQGSIQGLETRNYGSNIGDFNITETKYASASGYWNTVKDRLYYRAKNVAGDLASRPIGTGAISTSVSHIPNQGQITYDYSFDDRPCLFVEGARSEVINITDNHPKDLFASLAVLGRAAGPILQSIGTVTESTRNVSIEVVMEPVTGNCNTPCSLSGILFTASPRTQIETLLCCLQTDLTNSYSQVFKTEDSENWSPTSGRYSRNVTWTYTNCGDAPNTSFC